MDMNILGAGLAGLIMGTLNPTANIYDIAHGQGKQHHAILRLRSPELFKLLEMDFKKVTVTKGIYSNYEFERSTVKAQNAYSRKVIHNISERSISSIGDNGNRSTRYLPPDDFYEQLLNRCEDRIEWGVDALRYDFERLWRPSLTGIACINTTPLWQMVEYLDPDSYALIGELIESRSIYVTIYEIQSCNVHQTIYFPYEETQAYRASITGNKLTIESTHPMEIPHSHLFPFTGEIHQIISSFGIYPSECKLISANIIQNIGKIAAFDDDSIRQKAIYRLSTNHGVFSFGRFGTWRQITLDALPNDMSVIGVLTALNGYGRQKVAASMLGDKNDSYDRR